MKNETTNFGEDLFFDEPTSEIESEPSPEVPSAEQTQEAETTTDSSSSETKEQPFLTIQYNKESKGLTQEEATTLAQKGMNYDKVYQELQDLKAGELDPALKEIDFWAKRSNMTRQEYISFLRGNRLTQMVENEMENIRNQYPELSDEAAKEMAELRCKGKEEENARLEAEQAQAEREAELAPWHAFIEKYGITDASKIPAEVMEDINKGASPIEAMQRHEISELTKQLNAAKAEAEAAKKNNENKAAAMPSAATQAQAEEKDSFLSGLGF